MTTYIKIVTISDNRNDHHNTSLASKTMATAKNKEGRISSSIITVTATSVFCFTHVSILEIVVFTNLRGKTKAIIHTAYIALSISSTYSNWDWKYTLTNIQNSQRLWLGKPQYSLSE